MEVDAMVAVLFFGGREIKIRDSDLAGVAGGQIIERLTHDRVVFHGELMTIFEDQRGGDWRWFGSGFGRGLLVLARGSARMGWALVVRGDVGGWA